MPTTEQITDWYDRRPDFQTRFVTYAYPPYPPFEARHDQYPASLMETYPASSPTEPARYSSSRPTRTTFSLPGLSDGEHSGPQSSISTNHAIRQVHGYTPFIMEPDEDGALIQSIPERPPIATYPCSFYFLQCWDSFNNVNDWETHCRSHFRGHSPPKTVQCPYCDWFGVRTFNSASEAWQTRMDHIADHHARQGRTPQEARPDFHLFRHLWNKKIIGSVQLQELMQYPHMLASAPAYYMETQGPVASERRRPEPQRQRARGERRVTDQVIPRSHRELF